LHHPSVMNSKKIIGRIIKHVRKNKGFTQQELADGLDTDKPYISRLEAGKINLTVDYLDRIIKTLETNHAEFFNTKHII